MAKNKYGFIGSPMDDCIVPRPSPQSGAGSFPKVVDDAPKNTAMPIKPVQFADVEGGGSGSKGYGPDKNSK